MKFTYEQKVLLTECMKNKTLLIVNGKNGYGQPFKSVGCIKPGLKDDGIALYVANTGIGLYMGHSSLIIK